MLISRFDSAALIFTIFLCVSSSANSSAKDSEISDSRAIFTSQREARKVLSDSLSSKIEKNLFPKEISISSEKFDNIDKYRIKYTFNNELQDHAEDLLKKYHPDYSAIVMMNAKTGEIIAMSSFSRIEGNKSNLATKATYPAASIFKVITAAAAIDGAGLNPNHRIAFNGGNYTLYKRNVLSDRITRWTRFITLKDAFARSINTAFGRLSLENLEPSDLALYADKFSFNQSVTSDFQIDRSVASIPTSKGFAMTQVASGYNRYNTLSPVHGAMIASAIVNGGKLPTPYIVDRIFDQNNQCVYNAEPLEQNQIISAASAEKVKELMEQTVLSGTSRKTFKKIVRDKKFREIEMGGKTGHFSGTNPKGRTDWFIGYASDGTDKIAIAAITVNVKNWTVKSSALGEMMFRKYFKNKLEEKVN